MRIRKDITKGSFVMIWLAASLVTSGVLFGLLYAMEGTIGINVGIKEYWTCLVISPVVAIIIPLAIKYKPTWED